ncbi:MAG TPA: hypothetical protein VFO96_12380 [Gemmatimonadales bacterium]|jgi:hypothetical protein|nr:hypothetical protein [Gemmatimonadales bacterium]
MRASAIVPALGLLAACGTQGPAPAGPAPSQADTVVVWVTDARDTLTLHTDSLARLLHASAVQWQVADTRDASVLVARGQLPAVANGPFLKAFPAGTATAERLPWGRLYALISDSMVPIPALADSGSAVGVRDDLARFAVSTDAEPSITTPPVPLRCDSAIGRARETRPAIAYLNSDTVAREIAERLAALAGMTAIGLEQREFGWALSDGRDAGVVLAVPLVTGDSAPTIFCGARMTALLETRATLITRLAP